MVVFLFLVLWMARCQCGLGDESKFKMVLVSTATTVSPSAFGRSERNLTKEDLHNIPEIRYDMCLEAYNGNTSKRPYKCFYGIPDIPDERPTEWEEKGQPKVSVMFEVKSFKEISSHINDHVFGVYHYSNTNTKEPLKITAEMELETYSSVSHKVTSGHHLGSSTQAKVIIELIGMVGGGITYDHNMGSAQEEIKNRKEKVSNTLVMNLPPLSKVNISAKGLKKEVTFEVTYSVTFRGKVLVAFERHFLFVPLFDATEFVDVEYVVGAPLLIKEHVTINDVTHTGFLTVDDV